MPELVGIVDTGVMCCWLEVPGRSTAGSGAGKWDNAKANEAIDYIIRRNGTLVLPTSVIIETANHISQAPHSRKVKAEILFDRIVSSSEGEQPWRRFPEADRFWTPEWYRNARIEWPLYAERGVGLADFSIVTIARFFNEIGSEVRTLTTDGSLSAEVGYLAAPKRPKRRRRP